MCTPAVSSSAVPVTADCRRLGAPVRPRSAVRAAPAITDWAARLRQPERHGSQPGLLERLQALVAADQDPDLDDDALLEAWPVELWARPAA